MTAVAAVSAVVAAVGDANKIIEGIQKIGETLHTARSVVVIVENHTKRKLTRDWDHHNHGGWAVTPSTIIGGQEANIFSSQSKAGSIGTGTEAAMLYLLEGDEKLGLYIFWDNPAFGAKKCTAFLCTIVAESPLPGGLPIFSPYFDDTLKVVATGGVGNEKVEMRYELLRNE